MAGQSHAVELASNAPPWPLAFELAAHLPKGSWVLVGGLMVHVHALRAGVTASRPTADVDMLLNIETTSATEIGRALTGLGFVTVAPYRGNPVHRLTRGADVVDLLVARNVRTPTRWNQHPLLRSPGAAQALDRRDRYTLIGGEQSVVGRCAGRLGSTDREGRGVRDRSSQSAAASGGPRRTRRLSRLSANSRSRHAHAEGSPTPEPCHPSPHRPPSRRVGSSRHL